VILELSSVSEVQYKEIMLSNINIRYGSHQGGSPQDGLRDEQTCGMTLASAYVLHCLSAMWSQLQMMGRSPRWE